MTFVGGFPFTASYERLQFRAAPYFQGKKNERIRSMFTSHRFPIVGSQSRSVDFFGTVGTLKKGTLICRATRRQRALVDGTSRDGSFGLASFWQKYYALGTGSVLSGKWRPFLQTTVSMNTCNRVLRKSAR